MLRAKNQDQALDLLNSQSGTDIVICDRGPINKHEGFFLNAIHEIRETPLCLYYFNACTVQRYGW